MRMSAAEIVNGIKYCSALYAIEMFRASGSYPTRKEVAAECKRRRAASRANPMNDEFRYSKGYSKYA